MGELSSPVVLNGTSKTNGVTNGTSKDATALDAALSQAWERYTTRNPGSLALYETTLNYMPGANTRTVIHAKPFPLTIARGHSHTVEDVDGHQYVDFLNEYSAGIYGHDPEPLKKAIARTIEDGWALGANNIHQTKLAKMLLERFSNSMDMIRFTNSGTEANLMAVGAALNFTGRKKLLAFARGYHGSAFCFPYDSPDYPYSMNPHYDFVLAPYNDIEATEAVIASLPPDSLAAIIVEPMQGAGGCIPATLEFLQYIREVTTGVGALFILDEVMTSRCAWGGLQGKLGLRPDLSTIGKWAGGAMNFGAFGGRREIMEMFDPRKGQLTHSGTFNNNVITMAAGVAGCEILTRDVVTRMNDLGDKLRTSISEMIQRVFSVDKKRGCVAPKVFTTGVGSLLNVTFTGPNKDTMQALFYHHMLENGIFIATRGYAALSIENTEAQAKRYVEVVEEFLVRYKAVLE